MQDEHIVAVGLGFGDEGKGHAVDFLCSPFATHGNQIKSVIRFNGGPQTAHNVIDPLGMHHRFSQFGSGTLWGTPTYLSRFMLIDPLAFYWEKRHLDDHGFNTEQVTVDPDALIVTPFHIAVNKANKDTLAHGTCGAGIGETQRIADKYPEYALRVRDLFSLSHMNEKMKWLRNWAGTNRIPLLDLPIIASLIKEYQAWLDTVTVADDNTLRDLLNSGVCVFEGAQGVLLDEDFGFHPHTTWSKTTPSNAFILLAENRQEGNAVKIGVTRTYHTRHGAGPFPTELLLPLQHWTEKHNRDDGPQGRFRIGNLDLPLLRYAVNACRGLDGIAITHCDVPTGHVCDNHRIYVNEGTQLSVLELPTNITEQIALTEKLERLIPVFTTAYANSIPEIIGSFADTDIIMQSFGPNTNDWKET